NYDCTPGTLINTVNDTNCFVAASSSQTLSTLFPYTTLFRSSGDTNNNGSTSTCRSETVIVGKNSPATSTGVMDTHNTAVTTDDKTGRAHVSTPVTSRARMPSSA